MAVNKHKLSYIKRRLRYYEMAVKDACTSKSTNARFSEAHPSIHAAVQRQLEHWRAQLSIREQIIARRKAKND